MASKSYFCAVQHIFEMKRNFTLFLSSLILIGGMFAFVACNDDDTYADLRKKERKTISRFIKKGTLQLDESNDTLLYVAPIKVISESTFYEQGSTTNVAENEYVYFKNTGIYMQIVRQGAGDKLKEGESATVIARYTEMNLRGDSIQSSNTNLYYIALPEEMTITNSYGTFSASFVSGVMKSTYGSSVPSGWLVPFTYIHIGRQEKEDEEISKVRLIVPSEQGQENASSDVYACFYEITFQKGV